jgi:lipid-A-disaccharide synthase
MLKASEKLSYELKDLQFVLPLAPDVQEEDVRPILKDSTAHVKLVRNSIHEVLSLSRLVLVASGTATLETAIMGKPMVVLYRVSFPTYLIGKLLVKVKTIGLVNIVAGKAIVPELIQGDANGQRIAQEASNLLKNPSLYHRIEDELKVVKERLGSPGASAKAAHVALKMMGC